MNKDEASRKTRILFLFSPGKKIIQIFFFLPSFEFEFESTPDFFVAVDVDVVAAVAVAADVVVVAAVAADVVGAVVIVVDIFLD